MYPVARGNSDQDACFQCPLPLVCFVFCSAISENKLI